MGALYATGWGSMSDIWSTVHAERRSLADDLAGLTPDQWTTPSLCAGWDVHDVLAHINGTAKMSRLGFVRLFVRAGLNFERFTANQLNAERASDPQDTLATFRSVAGFTSTPPAAKVSRIVEAYVHGEDIRRPLGIAHEYPTEHIEGAIEYLARDRLSGSKKRLDGITLRATDADCTVGSGPVVEGPAIALLLAAAGRTVAHAELTGPGLALLRASS